MIRVSSEPESLKQILEGNFYQVPLYQRDYAWEIDQISDLYYDIENSEGQELYLGALLLSKINGSNNIFEVIDGQQRFITLLILLSIIRDNVDKSDLDKYLFDTPETIEKIDISSPDAKLRFIANKRDNEIFISFVKGLTPKADKTIKSHKCLSAAHEFLKRKVEDKKNQKGKDGIVEFGNRVIFKTTFINMVVENNRDKSLLFKTLNARGLELSQSELLKNEICRNPRPKNSKIEDIINKWDNIREEIEESKADIDYFIFHYMNSLDTAVNIRKNLETIKSGKTGRATNYYPPIPEKYLFDSYEYLLKETWLQF